MHRVAILFDNFGPYHLARLKASSQLCDVLAVEFGSLSLEYDWKASESYGLKRVMINSRGSSQDLSTAEFQKRLYSILCDFNPEVMLVPGWGHRYALLALQWGLTHLVPVICMSESTRWDAERSPIKEWVKRRIISLFSAALVGGTPHRDYMLNLGMPADRIFLGYDAVDNGFFSEGVRKIVEGRESRVKRTAVQDEAREIGSRRLEMGERKKPYFLASARFIEKKNLPRLLRAYAHYRGKNVPSTLDVRSSTAQSTWDLVIIGDGELRSDLEKLRSELGLEDCVQMPGFKQYEQLPSYYANAGAFIHASTTEPWGLVINEAMASGLPVLVSNRCGCATDLVQEGENGWTFDPFNVEQMADLMLRISSDEDGRLKMGVRSRDIIAIWGLDRFASGLTGAVQAALSEPRRGAGILDRLLLSVLIRR